MTPKSAVEKIREAADLLDEAAQHLRELAKAVANISSFVEEEEAEE